jgi:uncharacterized membrane protein YcaP (DUF421 family)
MFGVSLKAEDMQFWQVALRGVLVSDDDLLEDFRQQGLAHPTGAKQAVLERSGQLSVIKADNLDSRLLPPSQNGFSGRRMNLMAITAPVDLE